VRRHSEAGAALPFFGCILGGKIEPGNGGAFILRSLLQNPIRRDCRSRHRRFFQPLLTLATDGPSGERQIKQVGFSKRWRAIGPTDPWPRDSFAFTDHRGGVARKKIRLRPNRFVPRRRGSSGSGPTARGVMRRVPPSEAKHAAPDQMKPLGGAETRVFSRGFAWSDPEVARSISLDYPAPIERQNSTLCMPGPLENRFRK